MTEPKKKTKKVKRKPRKVKPETRQKMSESQRLRWARFHGNA